MSFVKDLGFPDEKVLKFDTTYGIISMSYDFEKYDSYEIELFIEDEYLIIVLRFPKNGKEKMMNIILDNFYFPSESEIKSLIPKKSRKELWGEMNKLSKEELYKLSGSMNVHLNEIEDRDEIALILLTESKQRIIKGLEKLKKSR